MYSWSVAMVICNHVCGINRLLAAGCSVPRSATYEYYKLGFTLPTVR